MSKSFGEEKGITEYIQAKEDGEWLKAVNNIDNPIDMLKVIQHFRDTCNFGDRYYRDMEKIIWKKVDDILDGT